MVLPAVDPEERIEVSLIVRPQRPLAELEARLSQATPGQPQPYLSREAYAAAYGADPADLARVTAFARQHGLQVVESDSARRTVRLAGRAADLSAAFGIDLLQRRDATGIVYRAPSAPPRLPVELQAVVTGVFGLDNHPLARPHA